MRAFMSNTDRGDGYDLGGWSPFGPAARVAAVTRHRDAALREARAILAETELVEGGYKACYVSVAYLCASLMPFNHNARVALAEALAAFVAEEE